MHPLQNLKEHFGQFVQKGQQQLEQLKGQLQTAASIEVLRPHSSVSASQLQASSFGPTVANAEVKTIRIKQELNASRINIHGLKRLTFHGVPDADPTLRATVWKVILGYLPPSPEEWPQALARRRAEYHGFCDELIIDPSKPIQAEINAMDTASDTAAATSGSGHHPGDPLVSSHAVPAVPTPSGHYSNDPLSESCPGLSIPLGLGSTGGTRALTSVKGGSGGQLLEGHDVTAVDHPLSLEASSRWNTFFQDNETMEQVTRDVVRTHPGMHFFTGEGEDAELHRQEMRRALFMYAKLNPGLRYIQGMNELIAPLYWLFKQDPDPQAAQFAEADAFWCFMDLISEFRDHFCQQLDNAQTGIKATIRKLMHVLQHHDYKLWHHIEAECKVDPQFYSFRWITLLLSQEFSLPDTLRIWDTILSDPHGRMDCLLRICTALILNVKDTLMQGDFTDIMRTLQRYPPVDITMLLQMAAAMPPCNEVLGAPV